MIGARWSCYDGDCERHQWTYADDFATATADARQHHADKHHNVQVWPDEAGGG